MKGELGRVESLLVLNGLPHVGPVMHRRLFEYFDGNLSAVLDASEKELMKVRGVGPKAAAVLRNWNEHFDLEREMLRLEQYDTQFIDSNHEGYPPLLKETWDPPLGLYWRGPLRVDEKSIAIVGSRRCTLYGESIARRFAAGLASRGWTVVSGMARGIDTAAHEGALGVGGQTLGVMGCGIDIIYPPENAELYRRLTEKGAVVSEFPFGRRADRQTFPMRNRVVAGMCRGIIVVESDVHGGSMITARFAGEQGRQVFAVPGRVDQASSRGCHALIRDGAVMASSVDEILQEFDYRGVQRELLPGEGGYGEVSESDLPPGDARLLWEWFGPVGTAGVEESSSGCGLSPERVGAAFLMLELNGFVKKRADGVFEKTMS